MASNGWRADTATGQQSRSDNGLNWSGVSVRAGTVADLIAQGPAPPCAACTLAADRGSKMQWKEGLFFQQGWVAVCSAHKALVSSQEARSVALPPVPAQSQSQPPVRVTSITARWRQQTSMRKQQMKKKQPTKHGAGRADVATPGSVRKSVC